MYRLIAILYRKINKEVLTMDKNKKMLYTIIGAVGALATAAAALFALKKHRCAEQKLIEEIDDIVSESEPEETETTEEPEETEETEETDDEQLPTEESESDDSVPEAAAE